MLTVEQQIRQECLLQAVKLADHFGESRNAIVYIAEVFRAFVQDGTVPKTED